MATRGALVVVVVLPLLMMRMSCVVAAAAAGTGSSSSKERCHSSDHAALVAIKAALGNPYHLASWTPDSPCCRWYDVDCDASTGYVVGLSIFQDTNISGAIPDAIAGLTHLRTLVLHHLPGISGPIPPAIARLSALSQLTISSTAVSGPVPSFLGRLAALTLLDLSFNSLSGAIPPSLAALPNLSGINLSRNSLTGAAPPLLLGYARAFPGQQSYLWLSHNNLSGSIPPEFAAVGFVTLDLSRNALSGDASALFGRARQLQHLDLLRNALSFNLSGVDLPEQLYSLDVSHNAIYGGVPAQVANLTNLRFFNVSYNRLCGALPTGGAMDSFDAYSFQHNRCLCGPPLPAPCNN